MYNVRFRVIALRSENTLKKKATLPSLLQSLKCPILLVDKVHKFAYLEVT